MSTLSDRLYAHARIVPVASQNKIVAILKLDNGDLQCTQASGNVFAIAAVETELQAFAVYTVLINGG